MSHETEKDVPSLRGIAALGEDAEALGLTEIPVEELLKELDAHDALAGVIYDALRPWMETTTPGRAIADSIAEAVRDAGWARVPRAAHAMSAPGDAELTEEYEAAVYDILTDDEYAEGVDPFDLSRVIVRRLLSARRDRGDDMTCARCGAETAYDAPAKRHVHKDPLVSLTADHAASLGLGQPGETPVGTGDTP